MILFAFVSFLAVLRLLLKLNVCLEKQLLAPGTNGVCSWNLMLACLTLWLTHAIPNLSCLQLITPEQYHSAGYAGTIHDRGLTVVRGIRTSQV